MTLYSTEKLQAIWERTIYLHSPPQTLELQLKITIIRHYNQKLMQLYMLQAYRHYNMLHLHRLTKSSAETAVTESSASTTRETFIPAHQSTVVVTHACTLELMALWLTNSCLSRHHHHFWYHKTHTQKPHFNIIISDPTNQIWKRNKIRANVSPISLKKRKVYRSHLFIYRLVNIYFIVKFLIARFNIFHKMMNERESYEKPRQWIAAWKAQVTSSPSCSYFSFSLIPLLKLLLKQLQNWSTSGFWSCVLPFILQNS